MTRKLPTCFKKTCMFAAHGTCRCEASWQYPHYVLVFTPHRIGYSLPVLLWTLSAGVVKLAHRIHNLFQSVAQLSQVTLHFLSQLVTPLNIHGKKKNSVQIFKFPLKSCLIHWINQPWRGHNLRGTNRPGKVEVLRWLAGKDEYREGRANKQKRWLSVASEGGSVPWPLTHSWSRSGLLMLSWDQREVKATKSYYCTHSWEYNAAQSARYMHTSSQIPIIRAIPDKIFFFFFFFKQTFKLHYVVFGEEI